MPTDRDENAPVCVKIQFTKIVDVNKAKTTVLTIGPMKNNGGGQGENSVCIFAFPDRNIFLPLSFKRGVDTMNKINKQGSYGC